jgi:4-amino-4-deoxy-L-arabinose transferase-like glycosyltransferase
VPPGVSAATRHLRQGSASLLGGSASREPAVTLDVAVALGLTAIALALRIPGLGQSLTLDEPHTYLIAKGSLGDVFHELRSGYEIHPPLYFLLAWGAAKVGDPAVWVRMPSFLLGSAAVPLTYLLGLRTVGRPAAAAGAAFLALSPFAVRYSTDARPYATLMFFVVLSTLALLWAARSNRPAAWVLYVASACAVVYSHYFGVFVVAGQAVWAVWACRDRLRTLAIAYAAAAVGFLPWLPSFLDQPHRTSDYAAAVPLKLRWLGDQALGLLPGTGYYDWRAIPGRGLTFVLVVALAAVVTLGALRLWSARNALQLRLDGPLLLAVVAVATPLGLLVASVVGDNVWLARYLGPALPAALLLLAALAMALPRPLAVAAVAVTLAVLAVGTFRGFEDRYSRADYKGAARFIEGRAGPRDVVLEFFLSSEPSRKKFAYVSPIDLNFKRHHRTVVASIGAARGSFAHPPPGAHVFVAGIEAGFLRLPRPAPADRLRLRAHRVFAGDSPVAVYEYEGGAR